MYEVSTLLSRPVLSRNKCCILGCVTDVYYDEKCKKIAYFTISCQSNDFFADGIYLLPFSCVSSFKDALVIDDYTYLINIDNIEKIGLINSLIGKKVYTSLGIDKGSIEHISFKKSGAICKLYTQTTDYSPSAFSAFGDVLLLKAIKKSKPKKSLLTLDKACTHNEVNDLNTFTTLTEYAIQNANADLKVSILPIKDENCQAIHPTTTPSNSNAIDKQQKNVDAYVFENLSQKADSYISLNTIQNTNENNSEKTSQNASVHDSDALKNINKSVDDKHQSSNIDIVEVAPQKVVAINGVNEREPVFTKDAFEKLVGAAINTYCADDAHTPTRIICDYDFLLGRVLIADLTSYIGEILATKNSIITKEIVERARRCGKLVELTLNSK